MGTGVGEAAMYGALFGGAKAAATGEDIITGALTGGATSGAMSGIMGSDLVGKAMTKSGPGIDAAGNSFSPLADTSAQYWSPATDISTSTAATTAYNPSATSMMQNVGVSNGYVPDPSYIGQTMSPMASTITPEQAIAAQNQIAGQGVTSATAAPAKQGMFDRGMNWWDSQDMLTKGMVSAGAGYGLGALTAPPPTVDALEEEENPMGLARYNRDQFTPSIPQANVYQPSYAQGGIAALAGGGYPQGRQDNTQYATPTQMPTSAEVINSDYEVATDPYMGTPLRMAEGGKAYGSSIPTPTRTVRQSTPVIDPKVIEAQRVAAAAAAAPKVTRRKIGMGMAGPIYADSNPRPSMATVNTIKQAPAKPASPTTFMAKDFRPNTGAVGRNTNIYRPQYAEGGIAGYNLGGYASGGNPRLLKGPGDGMSDNIPATIGDRQPARLADGEFVVPADVVSHLGNGSTDAGAKHLYNMMDKVRKARTGNKKQGKQIKASKFLPK